MRKHRGTYLSDTGCPELRSRPPVPRPEVPPAPPAASPPGSVQPSTSGHSGGCGSSPAGKKAGGVGRTQAQGPPSPGGRGSEAGPGPEETSCLRGGLLPTGSVLIQERNRHPALQLRFAPKLQRVTQLNPARLVFLCVCCYPIWVEEKKKNSTAFPCFSSKEFKKEQDVWTYRHPVSVQLDSPQSPLINRLGRHNHKDDTTTAHMSQERGYP